MIPYSADKGMSTEHCEKAKIITKNGTLSHN